MPGTSGFIGELMSVLGVYKYNAIYGFLIAFGLILGAIYMLKLVKVIIFAADNNKVSELNDLVITENILLLIFVFSTILLGLFPNLLLQFIDVSVIKILANYKGL